MPEAMVLIQEAARCFELARNAKNNAKNPAVAATLAEAGRQYVGKARELRQAKASAATGSEHRSNWIMPKCCG